MQQIINELQQWIKDYVTNALSKGVVIGMSGGKDSLVVAKLCANSIGKENVFGVIMPNGEMSDKSDAIKTCELLGIKYAIVNINDAYNAIINPVNDILKQNKINLNDVSTINTPPRIRMTTLYAFAGSLNYLVANTSNLSEISVGYSTKWGDGVGDFAPIANFTKTEVCEIGKLLGLPTNLVDKTPSDGLSGKSDEAKLGITYANLDEYIRTGKQNSDYDRIMHLNKISAHKRTLPARFENRFKNYLK